MQTYILAGVGLAAAVTMFALIIWLIRRMRKAPSDEIDLMEGHDFEYYCAELLRRSGFMEVEVTKGSGDYGIDILAEKDGVTYAIQCKRYAAPVGVKAVQEAYAGRDYYDRMVGAVLTNQYFTQPAVEAAKKTKDSIVGPRLSGRNAGGVNRSHWDCGYLEGMPEE